MACDRSSLSGGGLAPPVDFVFALSDSAADKAPPEWPGHPVTAHWGCHEPVPAAIGRDVSRGGATGRGAGTRRPPAAAQAAEAVSTMRPTTLPSRNRFSALSAFLSGSLVTGMGGILPCLAIPISSRSSFTLPT